ncbi:MAG: GDSL-type esterase/lipase family protein [Planctomycetota bacterium]
MTAIPFADGDTVVVIGERLVESEQQDPPPGSGWVRRLRDLVITHAPERRVEIIDATQPEQRLHLVRQRWCDDVLWHRPQWILLHMGLSDIHHLLGRKPEHMDPTAFGVALQDLLAWTARRLPHAKVVLIDPIFCSLDDDPAWGTGAVRRVLPSYHSQLRRIAAERDCVHVAVQDAVEERIAAEGESVFGRDEAHPEQEGSVLLASHVLAACGGDPGATPAVAADSNVVFIGDSITDAGRRQAHLRPWGTGYMRLWRARLLAHDPVVARSLRIINRGIGGQTIRNLQHRWERDVLAHEPDHLVVKIGINDCNRWLADGGDPVSPEDYASIMDELLARTRSVRSSCRITLLSPFYLSWDDHPQSYRRKVRDALPTYIAAGRRCADSHGARFVDLHAIFQKHLQRRSTRVFGGNQGADVVHPSETGCMVIAEALAAAQA